MEPPFVAIFHLPPLRACKGRANASEQIILFKGLAQVTKNAGRSRALANAVVRVRRDQDGWNGLSGNRQALIKLEPGHPRHLHIGDQARRAAAKARAQEFLRGGGGLDAISQRSHETLYRLAHWLIVVDD